MNNKKIVNVSSYQRIDSLVKTLESIIDQCDEINVVLNDYEGGLPDILYDKKINLFFGDNSKGDAFKFLKLTESEGYFLTIDDDLIYPHNYVNFMIEKCKEYDNKRVITLHGRNFVGFPINSYYRSASERYSCLHSVKGNFLVQFGGTGVMCFHTNLMKIDMDYFKYPNMADIWIGKYCIENNIEIICVRHEENFIKYIPQKTTIYDTESRSDKIQTLIVNQIFDPNYNKQGSVFLDQTIMKIETTLNKTQKSINYDKVNSIFQNQTKTIIPKQTSESNTNFKTNSGMIHKIMTQKKRR